MKPFRLVFEEGPLGVHGHATYKRGDLALVYAPPEDRVLTVQTKRVRAVDSLLGIYEHSVFLITDTLTLRFNENRILTSIDAYTNDQLWSHRDEEAPPITNGRGRLTIDWHLASDRVRVAGRPKFELQPERLHIYLQPAFRAEIYYEVGTGLTVGLGAGAIREIIIADLTVT